MPNEFYHESIKVQEKKGKGRPGQGLVLDNTKEPKVSLLREIFRKLFQKILKAKMNNKKTGHLFALSL